MPQTIHPDLHPLIRERWSPLGFANTPIPAADLTLCLEAARWAPSSYNDQPWRFVLCDRCRQPEAYEKLVSCLAPGNQSWAGRAPVLILTTTRANFRASDRANPHAWHDLGLTTENLVLQAQALGIHSHLIAGFDRSRARELFGVPDSYEPVTVLVLGYRCNPAEMDARDQACEDQPRERRTLQEIAFAGYWNESYDNPDNVDGGQ